MNERPICRLNKRWCPVLLIVWWLLACVLYSLTKYSSTVEYPQLVNDSHYLDFLQHPFLHQHCYHYSNLTTSFLCNQTGWFNSFSSDRIYNCVSNIWQKIRNVSDKYDPWNSDPNSPGKLDPITVSKRPNFHITVVGDSHMRYLFDVLVRRLAAPRVKYRIASFDQNRWEDAEVMYKSKKKHYHEAYHEIIHLDHPLKVSYWWDRLLQNFPKLLKEWTTGQKPKPTVVVFGTALHYMEDYKADFIKYGKEKGAEKYTQHLENLTPLLSAFANSTLTIFKMQDHLGRDLKRATNYDWNVDYYNEIAKKVLSKTPVLLWDSTLPLADMYQEECRVHKRSTPDTGDWQCQDYSHIGFIMVDQYLDMLLNHVCSNATRETSAKS